MARQFTHPSLRTEDTGRKTGYAEICIQRFPVQSGSQRSQLHIGKLR